MEESIAERLIAAAEKAQGDIGWTVEIRSPGICIRYTWLHENGQFYTVENFTVWRAIEQARINPLLLVMNDLIKQKTEWVPA